jgi:hypothetical protein
VCRCYTSLTEVRDESRPALSGDMGRGTGVPNDRHVVLGLIQVPSHLEARPSAPQDLNKRTAGVNLCRPHDFLVQIEDQLTTTEVFCPRWMEMTPPVFGLPPSTASMGAATVLQGKRGRLWGGACQCPENRALVSPHHGLKMMPRADQSPSLRSP